MARRWFQSTLCEIPNPANADAINDMYMQQLREMTKTSDLHSGFTRRQSPEYGHNIYTHAQEALAALPSIITAGPGWACLYISSSPTNFSGRVYLFENKNVKISGFLRARRVPWSKPSSLVIV